MNILESCSPRFCESVCSLSFDPSYEHAPCLEILCKWKGQRVTRWLVFKIYFDDWIYTGVQIYISEKFFLFLSLIFRFLRQTPMHSNFTLFLLHVSVHDDTCVFYVHDHTRSHMFVCIYDQTCTCMSMITHVRVHPWSHSCICVSMITHVHVHLHLCRRICVLEPVPPTRCLPQLNLHLRHRDKAFYLNLELIDWLD